MKETQTLIHACIQIVLQQLGGQVIRFVGLGLGFNRNKKGKGSGSSVWVGWSIKGLGRDGVSGLKGLCSVWVSFVMTSVQIQGIHIKYKAFT